MFPLSPGSSPTLVAYFAETVGIAQLYISDDLVVQSIAEAANVLLREKGVGLDLQLMPKLTDLSVAAAGEEEGHELADGDVVIILHSSGRNCVVTRGVTLISTCRYHWAPQVDPYDQTRPG